MSKSDFVLYKPPYNNRPSPRLITSTNSFSRLVFETLEYLKLCECSLFTWEGRDVLYGNIKSAVSNDGFSLEISQHIVGGNHFLVEARFDGWLESKLSIAENGNVIVLYASDWTLEEKLKYMGSFSDCQNCDSQYSCWLSLEPKEAKLKQCRYYRERFGADDK